MNQRRKAPFSRSSLKTVFYIVALVLLICSATVEAKSKKKGGKKKQAAQSPPVQTKSEKEARQERNKREGTLALAVENFIDSDNTTRKEILQCHACAVGASEIQIALNTTKKVDVEDVALEACESLPTKYGLLLINDVPQERFTKAVEDQKMKGKAIADLLQKRCISLVDKHLDHLGKAVNQTQDEFGMEICIQREGFCQYLVEQRQKAEKEAREEIGYRMPEGPITNFEATRIERPAGGPLDQEEEEEEEADIDHSEL
mmetsp:Transcript_16909/g.20393  ORF Transcript_16909/g.20393 Transcript_16909/m.20393 type:complete len:259 (+) Transcript_16909:106-882(+)|eukprot:CAMPEP_0197854020 /NCGR_PEP_ID=MMETSP1438-20131217/23896_1 /TAXON_ID=1461541 /ORGANISM="Pterosperma sp., Strain CCMP1384" /LENGTH=258 /DNA_ID=CAMNT_0043468633 /DNA_START=105 /DNA_END=881 /DNA_ORIENTATION=-